MTDITGTPRLCKDCKHFYVGHATYQCARIGFPPVDVVTGYQEDPGIKCNTERSRIAGWIGCCGPKGRFWEEKK